MHRNGHCCKKSAPTWWTLNIADFVFLFLTEARQIVSPALLPFAICDFKRYRERLLVVRRVPKGFGALDLPHEQHPKVCWYPINCQLLSPRTCAAQEARA